MNTLFAQVPEVLKYQRKDGIPTNTYNFQLIEDSKGFLWGASVLGVFRYNGNQFDYFGLRKGLPDQAALRLIEAPDKKIWVLTYSGELAYFDGDSFVAYPYNEKIKDISSRDHAWHFVVDNEKNIFLGHYRRGLWKVDNKGVVSSPVSYGKEWSGLGIWFPGNSLSPIVFGLMDSANLGTQILPDKVHLFDSGFRHAKSIPFRFLSQAPNYRSFFTRCHNNISIFSFGHYLFKISDYKLIEQIKLPAMINSINEYQNGDIWVATIDSGVFVYPKGNLTSPHVKQYFSGYTINWVMSDREKGVWLTVKGEGIWYIPNPSILKIVSDKFFTTSAGTDITISDDYVYILGKKGHILRLTYNKYGEIKWMKPLRVPHQNKIQSIYWDDYTKRLYVSYDTSMGYFSNEGDFHEIILKTPAHIKDEEDLHVLRAIKMRFYHSADTGVWAINYGGAFKFKDDSVIQVITAPANLNRHLALGSGNKQWLGGEEGIWCFANNTKSFIAQTSRVNDIAFVADRIWVSNNHTGTSVIKGDSVIKHWDVGDVPPNGCYVAEEDTLWAIGGPYILKFIYYSDDSIAVEKNKIIHNRDDLLYQLCLHNGCFWVFTTGGILQYQKQDISSTNIKPPVYITQFRINGKDTTLLPEYIFNHTQNYLQISFTGVSFQTRKMQFRYRLSGVDEEWQYSKQQSVQYTHLPPGDYLFEVYAQSNGGWSEKPALLSFIINPPFWGTWWFKILSTVLILSLIGAGFRWRYRRINAKREIEQQLIRLESKALRAQINPHFIFNVLSAIQDYVSKSDTVASEIYLVKFSHLIRLILENSRKSFSLMSNELELLRNYLDMERMRYKDQFDYTINLASDIDPDKVYIPPMLIQPYVENAVVHGVSNKVKNGMITISFSRVNSNSLRCEVSDNGAGRNNGRRSKTNHVYQPLGMLITRERLQLLNHSFNDKLEVEVEDLGVGTKVIIYIPTVIEDNKYAKIV